MKIFTTFDLFFKVLLFLVLQKFDFSYFFDRTRIGKNFSERISLTRPSGQKATLYSQSTTSSKREFTSISIVQNLKKIPHLTSVMLFSKIISKKNEREDLCEGGRPPVA